MPNENSEGYRGNKQLKLPNSKEYVDAQTFQFRMSELKKIYSDIKYFAENYFYIISLDQGKTLIKLYQKQEELIKTMTAKKRVICLSCRQSGKCVSPAASIKIRNKQTHEIEELTIYDFFNKIKNK